MADPRTKDMARSSGSPSEPDAASDPQRAATEPTNSARHGEEVEAVRRDLERVAEIVAAAQQAPPHRTLTPTPTTSSAHQPDVDERSAPQGVLSGAALGGPSTRFPTRLGSMLRDRELITQEELEAALEIQRSSGQRLGETLIEMGAISSENLTVVLADHLGVPFVDIRTVEVDEGTAGLLSEDVVRRYTALPVSRWGEKVVVAMANPNDVFALDDIRILIGAPIVAALAEPDELRDFINRRYHGASLDTSVDDARSLFSPTEQRSDAPDFALDAPIVRLVNTLLEQAVDQRASDVHIDPSSGDVQVRFRIDGVRQSISTFPREILRPLVSRLKVLGGVDIAQSRLPQNGRFSFIHHGRRVDVRVATIPITRGEAVTLRLLDQARGVPDMGALGLTDSEKARLDPAYHAAQGSIFVTGPTGAGKSSTLYAVLTAINSTDKNIISVEDPAEYDIDGVKQVQVNTRAGLTFPVALKAILRSDPDVVMIGEVRDAETARIAAEASITGHLVFATLHTTQAAAAPMRLVDMGVEPYLVASSLTCVVAQRLTRVLCDECARPADTDAVALLRELGADDATLQAPAIRTPTGCPACLNTGYRGRRAVFEIMPVSETIAHMVVERASTAAIERQAISEGMDTLRTAAMKRVAAGTLSIEEMLRTIV